MIQLWKSFFPNPAIDCVCAIPTDLRRESLRWPEATVLAKVQSNYRSTPRTSSADTQREAAQKVSPPAPQSQKMVSITSPHVFPHAGAAGAAAQPLTKEQPGYGSLTAGSCVKVPEKLSCFPQPHFSRKDGVVMAVSWWEGAVPSRASRAQGGGKSGSGSLGWATVHRRARPDLGFLDICINMQNCCFFHGL